MADNDFKYIVQSFSDYYIGARWTYAEMMENEDMPFKWKAVIRHYLLKEVAADTTLENHIFFMTEEDFAYQTLKELKAKFKMSIWVEGKRGRGGHYESKEYKIEEIVKSRQLHEQMDTIVVEELHLSKLALTMFAV